MSPKVSRSFRGLNSYVAEHPSAAAQDSRQPNDPDAEELLQIVCMASTTQSWISEAMVSKGMGYDSGDLAVKI
ncbi:unnamed protein product [Gadus morhua 'NCC']